MKKFQIKIHSEAHSKAVQERLFELGYWWPLKQNITEASHLQADCLHLNYSVDFEITHGPAEMHDQITLEDLYSDPERFQKKESEEIEVELGPRELAVLMPGFVEIRYSSDIINVTYSSIQSLYDACKKSGKL